MKNRKIIYFLTLVLPLTSLLGLAAAFGLYFFTDDSPKAEPVSAKGIFSDYFSFGAPSQGENARGVQNAEIVIVEFSDFQCPYCRDFHAELKEFLGTYSSSVRWVFKHYPISSHPYAAEAARAAECAGEQGKFWEYADRLFIDQEKINSEYFFSLAGALGLQASVFEECLAEGTAAAVRVAADRAEGERLGVRGTPTSFINGQKVEGVASFEQLQSMMNNQ